MPLPLEQLAPNDPLPARWLNDLAAEVRSQRLVRVPGMRVNRTPNGTFLEVPPAPAAKGGGGGGSVSARVVSVSSVSGVRYSGADVLTGGSVRIFVPVWAQHNALPSGTRLLALEIDAETAGGWA